MTIVTLTNFNNFEKAIELNFEQFLHWCTVDFTCFFMFETTPAPSVELIVFPNEK